jgi:hypothetical protein
MTVITYPEGEPKPKLPLGNTISLAYSTYFQHFADVLRASWLWLLLMAPLQGIAGWLQWSWMAMAVRNMKPGVPPKMSQPIEMMLFGHAATLALLFAGVSIAVAWHRRIILDEPPGLSASNVATMNVWRYVGIGFVLLLIMTLPVLVVIVPFSFWLAPFPAGGGTQPPNPQSFALIPVIMVLYVMALAVTLRLCLLLPARAVGDAELTFKRAWAVTRGNTWRMLWGIVVCTLPPTFAAQIALWVFVGFPGPGMFAEGFALRMTVVSTVFMVFYLLIAPIGIGFLSHVYRYFFNRVEK